MQLPTILKSFKSWRPTIYGAALAGVFTISMLLLAAGAGSAAVYYFYSYGALNTPVSAEFELKSLSVSDLEKLGKILEDRARVFQASTTPVTPQAFR